MISLSSTGCLDPADDLHTQLGASHLANTDCTSHPQHTYDDAYYESFSVTRPQSATNQGREEHLTL